MNSEYLQGKYSLLPQTGNQHPPLPLRITAWKVGRETTGTRTIRRLKMNDRTTMTANCRCGRMSTTKWECGWGAAAIAARWRTTIRAGRTKTMMEVRWQWRWDSNTDWGRDANVPTYQHRGVWQAWPCNSHRRTTTTARGQWGRWWPPLRHSQPSPWAAALGVETREQCAWGRRGKRAGATTTTGRWARAASYRKRLLMGCINDNGERVRDNDEGTATTTIRRHRQQAWRRQLHWTSHGMRRVFFSFFN